MFEVNIKEAQLCQLGQERDGLGPGCPMTILTAMWEVSIHMLHFGCHEELLGLWVCEQKVDLEGANL